MAGPNLPIHAGINSGAVRTIPKDWDPQWFRRFITDHMQWADYRNAIAGPGIVITGTEQQQGEISVGGSSAPPIVGPLNITTSTVGVAVSNAGAVGIQALSWSNSAGSGSIGITNLGTSQIVVTGALQLLVPGSKGVTISAAGDVTILAPTSGPALTVNQVAGNTGIVINPGDSASVAIRIIDPGSNGTDFRFETTNSLAVIQANGTSTSVVIQSSGGTAITIAPTRQVTIAAPSTGINSLVVTGASGATPIAISVVGGPNSVFNVSGANTTGTAAATFAAVANKPGAAGANPTTWMLVSLGGSQFYIPCWS